MSNNKKRKPRQIHVDKLIIKANEVVFDQDKKKVETEEDQRSNERRPDPWGFFFQNWGTERREADDQQSVEASSEEKSTEEEVSEEKRTEEASEEERPQGWSWI